MCVSYVLDIKTHFHKYDWQVFSPIYYVAFHLADGFHCCAEALQFDAVSLVDSCFCSLCFWCQIQKLIAKTDVKSLPPMFSSRRYTVSGLTCKSSII